MRSLFIVALPLIIVMVSCKGPEVLYDGQPPLTLINEEDLIGEWVLMEVTSDPNDSTQTAYVEHSGQMALFTSDGKVTLNGFRTVQGAFELTNGSLKVNMDDPLDFGALVHLGYLHEPMSIYRLSAGFIIGRGSKRASVFLVFEKINPYPSVDDLAGLWSLDSTRTIYYGKWLSPIVGEPSGSWEVDEDGNVTQNLVFPELTTSGRFEVNQDSIMFEEGDAPFLVVDYSGNKMTLDLYGDDSTNTHKYWYFTRVEQDNDMLGTWKIIDIKPNSSYMDTVTMEQARDVLIGLEFDFRSTGTVICLTGPGELKGDWEYEANRTALYVNINALEMTGYRKVMFHENGNMVWAEGINFLIEFEKLDD